MLISIQLVNSDLFYQLNKFSNRSSCVQEWAEIPMSEVITLYKFLNYDDHGNLFVYFWHKRNKSFTKMFYKMPFINTKLLNIWFIPFFDILIIYRS